MVVRCLEPSDVGYGISIVSNIWRDRRGTTSSIRPVMFLIDAHLDVLLLLILMSNQFFGLEGFSFLTAQSFMGVRSHTVFRCVVHFRGQDV